MRRRGVGRGGGNESTTGIVYLSVTSAVLASSSKKRSSSSSRFVPPAKEYHDAALSSPSYADRRKLIERGFLADDEHHWTLTDEGKRSVRGDGATDQELAGFARRHRALRGEALVAETYRRFPYYATRSEIAERIFGGDPAALQRIQEARPAPRGLSLSTIGYEGRSLESYLNELLRAGVSLLCDVRRNPISRKYGFSKSTLAKGCVGVGVRYEHLPELGIASEQRQSLETQADYDALFDEYERESLPHQRRALETIQSWVRSGQGVALTCYERLPQQCHRRCVADALERELGRSFAAKHL